MAIRISTAIIAACVLTLGASASFAAWTPAGNARGFELVQYDRYGNQPPPYGYGAQNAPPYGYEDRDRDRYDDRGRDRDFRGGPRKWVPGEVLPPQLLGRVVVDWEERGLSRPPNGHQWVRVGLQFILVRNGDRKIARILNFD